MRTMTTAWAALGALLLFGASGCADDDTEPANTTGAGNTGVGAAGGDAPGGGGQGGSGGSPAGEIAIEAVSAPDETSVVVTFVDDVAAIATLTLAIASEAVGPLAIESQTYDPATRRLTLQTVKQKLGATYAIEVEAPGQPFDGIGDDFIAADTAQFWASDFGSPTFADYLVTANREAVGEAGVVYVEQGMSAPDVDVALDTFDTLIHPIETALFTEAPDLDENEKIVLLGLDGENYYGGYFSPVNTMTDAEAMSLWGVHSNEMEMLYINVALGSFDVGTLAHEFQHLLYQEQHPSLLDDWSYHNEGLAECAVRAVFGDNPYAMQYFLLDPTGELATGHSLVHWKYSNYDQYVLAYLYWTYVASQLGGPDAYGDLFALSGEPAAIDDYLQAELGLSFTDAELGMHIATWVKAPSGPHGFGSMLTWPTTPPPTVPFGTASLNLEPFEAAIFQPGVPSVAYPGTQGPNIRYAGINGAGAVDLESPFDVDGGALVVLNARFDAGDPTPEASGPNLMPLVGPLAPKAVSAERDAMARTELRRHPPPVHPNNRQALAAWREASRPL